MPCFLFIFLGAPYVEALRHNQSLAAALTAITAAVVGVIANLAVYFAIHTLFAEANDRRWGLVHIEVPNLSTISPRAMAVAVLALLLLFRLRWSVLKTLGACALVGGAAPLVAS